MPFCFLCMVNLPNISLLCKHFHIKHTTHDFTSYNCAEIGCSKSFHLLNSLKKHLATHTLNECTLTKKTFSTHDVTVKNLSTENINDNTIPIDMLDIIPYIPKSSLNNNGSTENSITNLIGSLNANPQIPRNVAQTVVESMTDIFHSLHQAIKEKNNQLLLNYTISNESFDHFNNILNAFEHL